MREWLRPEFKIGEDPFDGLFLGWVIFVPLLVVTVATAPLAWRWSRQRSRWIKIPVRALYLSYFLAPSLVGAFGPTGAFALSGPAFLMLTFGQLQLKLLLGAVPILICWPLVCLGYRARKVWFEKE